MWQKMKSIKLLLLLICLCSLSSCASTKIKQAADSKNITEPEEANLSPEEMQALKEAKEKEEQEKREEEQRKLEAKRIRVAKDIAETTANMSEEQTKFYTIKNSFEYEVIGEDLDYMIIVNDEKKQVILQYEESDSEEDWKNNYLFWAWPLKLDNKIVWTTYGYAKIYKSSKNIPMDEFCKAIDEHTEYKIVIQGWSLGSAMAKISARHFSIRTKGKKKIDVLTTFGDVKCWYNPFYSVKKHCVKIREYVTPNDLISWCVPVCRRDVKCIVGPKFSFKESKNSEDYHMGYENYDYSKWE